MLPLILGGLTLSVGVVGQHLQFSQQADEVLERRADGDGCGAQPKASAPHQNIWAGLTNRELADAIGFLYKSKELNLTQNGGR